MQGQLRHYLPRQANNAQILHDDAMLFVSSKVSQLALLPQGRVEAARRVKNMVRMFWTVLRASDMLLTVVELSWAMTS